MGWYIQEWEQKKCSLRATLADVKELAFCFGEKLLFDEDGNFEFPTSESGIVAGKRDGANVSLAEVSMGSTGTRDAIDIPRNFWPKTQGDLSAVFTDDEGNPGEFSVKNGEAKGL